MRLLVIFFLAISIHILNAEEGKKQEELSLVEKLRPTLMKVLGEEWTVKLIGADKTISIDELPMPTIPAIVSDARSVAVYDKKQDKIVLKPELEEKYYYGFIKELYQSVRLEKPNEDEVAKMMNVLSQGGTREGLYRSLVLDNMYAGMENWDKPVKKPTGEFAIYFYQKYFNKKISKESFNDMNVFTLKRLIAEKALEILDAYASNREDMEKWYGNMSADLAMRFPHIWASNLRKNPSAIAHKKWAEKVPVQHIKSEVIIKIHTALNSMM